MICKICSALDFDISDIMEMVEDNSKRKGDNKKYDQVSNSLQWNRCY